MNLTWEWGRGAAGWGWGGWPEGIGVESRDGEVGQASGQDVAWQTTSVPSGHPPTLTAFHLSSTFTN